MRNNRMMLMAAAALLVIGGAAFQAHPKGRFTLESDRFSES